MRSRLRPAVAACCIALPAAAAAVLPLQAWGQPANAAIQSRWSDAPAPRYALVPWPAQLDTVPGGFSLSAAPSIVVIGGAEVDVLGQRLAGWIRDATGLDPAVSSRPGGRAAGGEIVLALDSTTALPPEGYRLVVTEDGVRVTAATPAGLHHGVQTLRQLLPIRRQDGPASATLIPAVRIEDAPRFRYRGMHLDVVRHLFPLSFIKRYIDLLAMYGINTFHWHLTDDQGWRIEILRYPRLTEVGSWRAETVVGHGGRDTPLRYDGTRYGGYYTQDEIREIVAYAAARYVTIVPEIELPGHAVAVLAAYPELACTDGPFEVLTKWGVSEDILCPKEETFEFLRNVLSEVMALFPGEYIHIGGDEAPKRAWEQSALAQQVIRNEGLADEHELQSWFIRRVERFLNANGRKLIGWDEIMEGGLSPTATMMFWRDWATLPGPDGALVSAAKVAAGRGNDIVMTPNGTLYFDHYQADPAGEPLAFGGYSTLRRVYDYDPVPASFTAAEARNVIGAQANLWSEYITTPEHAEYMLLPRLLALAEVVWSPRAERDWASFAERVPAQLARLDALGINYRRPYDATLAVPASAASAERPRVIGYLASWGVVDGLRIRSLPAARLTHLLYAFGSVGEDGLAAHGSACLDVGRCDKPDAPDALAVQRLGTSFAALAALKREHPQLKVLISLGGWGGSRWFSDAAATAEGRQRLAASTINLFLRRWPAVFDGIDVDWEFPVQGGLPQNRYRPADRRNLTLLMEEYRRQLDALAAETGRPYELAIAASARPGEIANLEPARLARVLDFINVMTYDYHSTDRIAHFNAPLRARADDPTPRLNVHASMRAFLDAGVPARQLVVGAPFYGRGYGSVSPLHDGLFQPGDRAAAGEWAELDYRTLIRRRPAEHGFRRFYDAAAAVPWLYNPDTGVFFSYDGPDGVRAKADYVRAQGLGGIMFWQIGGDDGTLLRAIDDALTRAAPASSAGRRQ